MSCSNYAKFNNKPMNNYKKNQKTIYQFWKKKNIMN